MALEALNERHAAQIQAGTQGRRRGHTFEAEIANYINTVQKPVARTPLASQDCLFTGAPGQLLLNFILNDLKLESVQGAAAFSVGALATAETGEKELLLDGQSLRRCKSDVIVRLTDGWKTITKGVSIKQCSNKSPTNAQLYFSTATAFCELLRNNRIAVSAEAVVAFRMFCGDAGFRPTDPARRCDPTRWFWEELPAKGRAELERIFTGHQDDITRLLLQNAYANDPYPPDFVMHQTHGAPANNCEVAVLTIDNFIRLSREYAGFALKPYRVKKGSHKDPPGVEHLAPRFGVIQFQRGGQKQHPTQLQFNLRAGYFYHPPFSNPNP